MFQLASLPGCVTLLHPGEKFVQTAANMIKHTCSEYNVNLSLETFNSLVFHITKKIHSIISSGCKEVTMNDTRLISTLLLDIAHPSLKAQIGNINMKSIILDQMSKLLEHLQPLIADITKHNMEQYNKSFSRA